ncbi:hypothetical protein BC939DRAFT_330949 [Gamsiella multidivaricata]|uniref:uncharacterized protein n=1 Tax=Gamsiella multidivaricata TaxID=101098 RepID=UPI00221F7E74|nr:uncharacterized protein BC939DRAFT_330949 [Gamsiella multidivaricata]KAI7817405.1 hypothetical protein BC939DRAFT_330949 [Gamsiella multidivaricata]
MPRFKARPLNPKVFTSAGDLGVPRIQKRPLTVPVSPEFSKRKTRSVVAESDLKAKEVVNGAAAMRLKNMVRTEKAAVSHSRPSDIHKLSQPTIPERNNLQTIGAGVQTTMFGRKGVAATAAIRMSATPVTLSGFNPLVVPSVDQTRTKTHLCSITGPPRREEGPSTPPIPKAPILTTTTSRSKSRSKSQPGPPMSKLRRPVTRPVPFAFATSELQRRRMLFEPTISKPTEAATSSAAAPVSPIISTVLTASTAARFTSSASALRLEDL